LNADTEHWRALVAGFFGGLVYALYYLSAALLSGQRPTPPDVWRALGQAGGGVITGAILARYCAPAISQYLPAGMKGDAEIAGLMIGILGVSIIPNLIKAAQVWVAKKTGEVG